MNKLELAKKANEVRKGIVTAVHSAKAGHPGGSLSAADLFTYLYFEEMNIDPKDPKKADRDRFVLSKGHASAGLYATLAERGFFEKEELKDFFALTDIVISRAGANAICELLALHKPNLLIPLSANASRGDQILNARSFERQGFSIVLEEENLKDITLLNAVNSLYEHREQYMHAMKNSSQQNSIDTIIDLIESVTA